MDPNLFTKLCDAVEASNVDKVKEYLKQVQDVNALNITYDDVGRMVIHRVISTFTSPSDKLEVLQLLLEKGVNINGLTKNNYVSMISFVLAAGLFKHQESLQLLNFLLKNGANPNQHFSADPVGLGSGNGLLETECTALHLQVYPDQNRRIELLLLLLAYTKNPNAALRGSGYTPLHVAMFHQNPEAVLAFLRHPDINTEYRNHLDHTPLAMAVQLLSLEYKKTNAQETWTTINLCKIIKFLKIAGSTLSQEEVKQLTQSAGGYEKIDILLKNVNSHIERIRRTPYFRNVAESKNTFRGSESLTKEQALLLLQWRTIIQYDSALLELCAILKGRDMWRHNCYELIFKALSESVEKLCSYTDIEKILDKLPSKLWNEISSLSFHEEVFFKGIWLLKRALDFEYIFYTILNARSFETGSGVFRTLPQEILNIIFEYTLVACTTIQLLKPLQDGVEMIPDDINSSSMPRLSLVG